MDTQLRQRSDDLKLLYKLSAELRVGSARADLTSVEQRQIKRTIEALTNAITALEQQVMA